MIWHWWFVPLAVFAVGCLWTRSLHIETQRNAGGMFPDIGPAIILIGTLFTTGAIIVGHFI